MKTQVPWLPIPKENRRRPRKTKPGRRGPTAFPGITADAKTLGVNRNTLYRMLSGEKPWANLKTLRRRYDQLQREKERKAS